MPDQADKLRQLIHSPPPSLCDVQTGPPMVVVTGARPGVGATSVAVNLAAVLSDHIERVLLVDADDQRSNMAEIAGLRRTNDHSLADVLSGKCTISDAMSPGPGGMKLLTRGRVSPRRGCASSPRRIVDRRDSPTRACDTHSRLISELPSLRNDVDLLVIDTGNGLTPSTRRFWLASQLVLMVATADDEAILDAYAAIKLHAEGASIASIRLLINQSQSDRSATNAHRRLSSCCQRFLAHDLAALPPLPAHTTHELTDSNTRPRVWEDPNSPFGHAALWLGRAVSDLLSTAASQNSSPNKPRHRHHAERALC